MNILLLTTHLNSGGITTYLYTLAKGLIKQGLKVFIVSSGGTKEKEFEAIGATVIHLNIKTKSILSWRVYAALGPIKKIIKENNIVIIHSHTRITQYIGHILGKTLNIPYVATCHGFYKRGLGRRLFPCWGDAVIAISNSVRVHLEKDFKVPGDKVNLIHNGIDIDYFPLIDQKAKEENRKKFNLNGAGPIIGIVARLADIKGQDILLMATKRVIEQIPDIKLLIVGEGKTDMKLRQMVDHLGLSASVEFHSFVARAWEYLSVLDVFILPSREEGFGISVLEAKAVGLPVIASRVGGLKSIIEHGKTGILVEPENVGALTEAIIALVKDKEGMRKMGEAARVSVEENFYADKMVEKALNLYQRLLI